MSFDLVMRTLGIMACLYTVAFFVTTMSVSALNAVTYNSGPMCGDGGCVTLAQDRRFGAMPSRETEEKAVWLAASILN